MRYGVTTGLPRKKKIPTVYTVMGMKGYYEPLRKNYRRRYYMQSRKVQVVPSHTMATVLLFTASLSFDRNARIIGKDL